MHNVAFLQQRPGLPLNFVHVWLAEPIRLARRLIVLERNGVEDTPLSRQVCRQVLREAISILINHKTPLLIQRTNHRQLRRWRQSRRQWQLTAKAITANFQANASIWRQTESTPAMRTHYRHEAYIVVAVVAVVAIKATIVAMRMPVEAVVRSVPRFPTAV